VFKSPSLSNHSSEIYLRILHIIVEKPTEYTEWQRLLSGVHSIMMEKLAQAGEGGDTPTPFHYIYHHGPKLLCTLQLRGQLHSP
jgi:hypothetical protein